MLDSAFSVIPKDIGNLPTGNPTYGIFEYITFLDDTFFNAWMELSQVGNLGLCFGLVATAFLTRILFVPGNVYS